MKIDKQLMQYIVMFIYAAQFLEELRPALPELMEQASKDGDNELAEVDSGIYRDDRKMIEVEASFPVSLINYMQGNADMLEAVLVYHLIRASFDKKDELAFDALLDASNFVAQATDEMLEGINKVIEEYHVKRPTRELFVQLFQQFCSGKAVTEKWNDLIS